MTQAMGMTEAVKSVFTKYAVFEGRASRSEYWYFVLFLSVAGMAVKILDGLLGTDIELFPEFRSSIPQFGYLSACWIAATMIPLYAVYVRRLHDTDHSGWFVFLSFLPVIGWILLFIWLCSKGTDGRNRFDVGSSSQASSHPLLAVKVPLPARKRSFGCLLWAIPLGLLFAAAVWNDLPPKTERPDAVSEVVPSPNDIASLNGWAPPANFEKITTESGQEFGLRMLENYGCENVLFNCGKFEVVSAQDCSTITAEYNVYDTAMRQIGSSTHSVANVEKDTVVLMKFYMYENASDSFKVTSLICSDG